MEDLTPRQIVVELDKYIVGQNKAKKSVAIALRNRYRRQKLAKDMQDDIMPKNILMIGSTGVGKTEIARRLAKLVNAPFVKVEATKFTEVGYVGRDVESMVRDLVETAIRMVRGEKLSLVESKASVIAEQRILDLLCPETRKGTTFKNPFETFFSGSTDDDASENDDIEVEKTVENQKRRVELKKKLEKGEIEEEYLEIEVDDSAPPMVEVFSGSGMEEMGINIQDMLGGMLPKKKKKRKVTIGEARKIITTEEASKIIDMDEVIADAVNRAEEAGIIFLDEIDKIAGKESNNADVSRGGVQRDILPIVEGSTVMTKYGPVRTDHVLFIAAGAFHTSKPSDLMPELQGRFPIRVELENLTKDNFKDILIEPQNALIKQYIALLETEGIFVEFTEKALDEIAELAYTVNEQTENIGARRLHTILEKVLEEISFEAPELEEKNITICDSYVHNKLSEVVHNHDLSKYIL